MICINVSIFYVFSKNWPFNMNAKFEVWPVNSTFWTDFDRSGRCDRTTSSLCVLLEINMSNNRNVSKYIEVQLEEILPENTFSVFMETC